MIWSLVNVVNKSYKRYLVEREHPSTLIDVIDSDSDIDCNDPNIFPIEELQDQIQQLLWEYREYISTFSEKKIKQSFASFSQKHQSGFDNHSNWSKRKISQNGRLCKRRNSIKKDSIYSAKFGHSKHEDKTQPEDFKINEDVQLGKPEILFGYFYLNHKFSLIKIEI